MIMDLCLIVFGMAVCLHGYRMFWTLRSLPQIHTGAFDGELVRAGASFIARRPSRNGARRTIICFPGFQEDMRYFQALYAQEASELILLNNANYHCPFNAAQATQLDWPDNPFRVGTIEHDGFYLNLAIDRLARGEEIFLHGHSRGAAVVLEAGRQKPRCEGSERRIISAFLEAPVLPQARVVGNGAKPLPHLIICYLMPIFFGHMRDISRERLVKMPMMQPNNELKTRLCLSIFTTPRNYAVCVTNFRSIVRWQRETGFDAYENFATINVIIGARDSILNRQSMLASANAGQALNGGVSIIQTRNTNHFISLEKPQDILRLL